MRYVVEMDTGLRGYRLTGDQTFLDSYNDAKSKVTDQAQLLQRLTADNAGQQRRLQELFDLDSRWVSWADQQLKEHPGDPSTQQELLSGQQLITAIRDKQREFINVEEALRRTRSRRASNLNVLGVGSAILLSLLIASLLFTLTRRELLKLSSAYERHLQIEAERARELQESREFFRITFRSLGEAAIAADPNGKISFINPAASELTGWSDQESIGRPLRDVLRLIDERTRFDLEDPMERVRQAQAAVATSNHVALLRRDGQELPVELNGAPILNDRGKLAGVVILFRDITQRRLIEQTLRASERLTLAGRLSATIAHEIRNPLDTVSNLVYLMEHEAGQSTATMQYLKMASDELARITQITSQLLTFHREARAPVKVDLPDVLESVVTLFAPQIRKNHIQVDQRFDSSVPVRGYPGELRQVFLNLVGNAIDAMPQGGKLVLHVRQSSVPSDHSRRGMRVTIADNGTGIAPGVRINLFAPFYTTKGEKGTGLGLWVCRGILEKHEGTIHLSSTVRPERSGTAFSVFLPFEQEGGMLEVPEAPPAA
jgi:PAS domain S-box-containing protein